ncbi:hypothetical protein [Halorhodospira halophila]|uniref:Uncharacterized protein n=1 Tax=Halorhodospira halophila (strain DSM 244 / SL1) TaxID=349124 RepID=A1WU47_HALHL|nr:hypothetical protein [Halorhodospira halophila]ABM61209.1 hypothetical protein Hhal_0420 [Halorhodospira halophila SL1]
MLWDRVLEYWYKCIEGRETPSHLFAEALGVALHHFDDLVSQGTESGTNAQAKLPGGEIVRRFLEEPESFPFRVMGRNGGFTGADLKRDIASPTTWQAQMYEVSTDDVPPNRNWFPIEEFVKATQNPDYLDASR